jgi:hypothetical protein
MNGLFCSMELHVTIVYADAWPALFPIGFVALVITIVIIAVYVNYKMEKKRTEDLRVLANSLSFDFFPEGDDSAINALGAFQLFQIGRAKKIKNLMQGNAMGLTISLFDYTYVTGSGKQQQTVTQSVFVARRAGMDLPMFNLRPKSFWDRVGHFFGAKDIDFETHSAFTRLYLVKGNDEPEIRAVFSDAALDFFATHPNLHVEGNAERLMYYRGERVKPEKLKDFMVEGFEALKLFPSTDQE